MARKDPGDPIKEGITIVEKGGNQILNKFRREIGAAGSEAVPGQRTEGKSYKQAYESSPDSQKKYSFPEFKAAAEKWNKENPKADSTGTPAVAATPDKLELSDVASPGTPGKPADKVDTFTGYERRVGNRSEKVARRQERQMGRQDARQIRKGIKHGDFKAGDMIPGSNVTRGEALQKANMAKRGNGPVGSDRAVNSDNYFSMSQGQTTNAMRTHKVDFKGIPSRGIAGSPGSSQTILSADEANKVKGRPNYREHSDLTAGTKSKSSKSKTFGR